MSGFRAQPTHPLGKKGAVEWIDKSPSFAPVPQGSLAITTTVNGNENLEAEVR